MDMETIAGLLLNFSAVVGAITIRQPSYVHSRVTAPVAPLLGVAGTIAGFASIFALIRAHGIGYGLLWWAISGIAFAAVCMRLFDGVRSLLGLASLLIGGVLFVRTIW
jgi:hypothetical protein